MVMKNLELVTLSIFSDEWDSEESGTFEDDQKI